MTPWGVFGAVGGVPHREPRPREDVDAVREGGGGCCCAAIAVGERCQNASFPHHVFFHSKYSFSSRLLSNAARYRSYDSRKFLSTREENINSPRGLFAGGIACMGRVIDADLDRVPDEGDRGGDAEGADDGSCGLGKKKESGFQ